MAQSQVEPVHIPERVQDLLRWDTRAFANLALARRDGTPHVSPVWFDWDGEHIIINTARGRIKDRVLSRHPVVSLSILDPHNSYRYVLLTGPVVEETEEGGYQMISRLNEKYGRYPTYPKVPGQVRVTYKIRPERVFAPK